MQIDLHLLDRKYERLKLRNRKDETRLVAALADRGEVSPVVVVASRETPGRYVVIDGYKRLRAVARLGQDVVETVVWEHDEVDALVMVHHLQRPRERSQLEDAYLVQALHDLHGLTQPEIARRLGRSRSWVSRRLGLVKELPEWLQQLIQAGKLQCHAATKCFLPMARANKEDAERLARNIADLGLSTRQIAELYRAWLEGNERTRELVVSQPETALRARDAASVEADTDVGLLLQDLEKVASLAHRASRLLDRALLKGIEPSMAARITQAGRRAHTQATRVFKRIEREVRADDRSGDAKCSAQTEAAGLRDQAHRPDAQDLPLGGTTGPGERDRPGAGHRAGHNGCEAPGPH